MRFIKLWLFIILSSLVMSPRLGEEGLLSSVRIDDLLVPLSVIIALVYKPMYFQKLRILVPFLRLYFFTTLIAILNHISGFNDIALFPKLAPVIKQLSFLVYFYLFFVYFSRVKNFKKIYLITFFVLLQISFMQCTK